MTEKNTQRAHINRKRNPKFARKKIQATCENPSKNVTPDIIQMLELPVTAATHQKRIVIIRWERLGSPISLASPFLDRYANELVYLEHKTISNMFGASTRLSHFLHF